MTVTEFVSEYYGKTVQKTEDLEFDACCRRYDLSLLGPITAEVKEKRYGCGVNHSSWKGALCSILGVVLGSTASLPRSLSANQVV